MMSPKIFLFTFAVLAATMVHAIGESVSGADGWLSGDTKSVTLVSGSDFFGQQVGVCYVKMLALENKPFTVWTTGSNAVTITAFESANSESDPTLALSVSSEPDCINYRLLMSAADWSWYEGEIINGKATFYLRLEGLVGQNVILHHSNEVIELTSNSVVTTVDSHEVTYCVPMWGDGARVMDCFVRAGGYCIVPSEVDGLKVVSINGSSFLRKDELTGIELPFPVTSDNASQLNAFPKLTSITAKKTDGSYQFLICENGVIYDEGKTTLYFVKDDTVEFVLPATVNTIMDNAFVNATQLKSMTIDEGNESFAIVNDMICNKAGTAIIAALPYMKTLDFPEGVVVADAVNWSSFSYCHSLSNFIYRSTPLCRQQLANMGFPSEQLQRFVSVTIDDSVTEIGDHAFEGFSGLCDVQMSANVRRIGAYAFSGCSIGMLTVPWSVEELGVCFYSGGILRLECPLCHFTEEPGDDPCDVSEPWWLSTVLDPYNTYIICSEDVSDEWNDAIYYGGFNLPDQSCSWNAYGWVMNGRIDGGCVVVDDLHCNRAMAWDGTETLSIPNSVGPFPIVAVWNLDGIGTLENFVFPASLKSIGGCLNSVIRSGVKTVTFEGGVPNGFTECLPELFDNEVTVRYPDAFADEWSLFVGEDGKVRFADQPYEIVAGVKYYFTYGDGGATIVCAEPAPCVPSALRVPGKLLGLPVKGIGASPFGNDFKYACTSLAIPEGVETIGEGAFGGFSRLTTLVLPASVSLVMGGAFYGGSSLRTLTFANPEIVTYDHETGESAFDSSTMPSMVAAVRIPDGISTVNLRTVKVPEGTTKIPAGAFAGCANLSDLALPDSLTMISKCAFAGCKSLSRVRIPRGVTEIEDGAFAFCSLLSEIALPVNLNKIGNGLFMLCSSLCDVEIPARVKEIGSYAFFGCAADRFVIPASVEKVGENVFAEYGCVKDVCRGLTTESLGGIPLLVFKGGMPEGFYSMLPDGVSADEVMNTVLPQVLLEWAQDLRDDPNGSVARFLVQEREVFYNRLDRSGVDMNRLFSFAETYIAHADAEDGTWDDIWAFGYNPYGCSRPLSFEDGNGCFDFVVTDRGVEVVGGEFYDEFTLGDDGKMSSVSTIPSAILTLPVVRIGECAFEGSWRDFSEWGIRPKMSVELPYTLKEVGDFAFADCNWLSDIIIPEGADVLGWAAFAGCTELHKVVLPSTLAFVGDEAFAGCTKLRDVEFSSKGMTALGVGAFMACSSLEEVSLYGIDVVGDAAFEGCESLQRVMFDAVLSLIGVDAFNACFKLQQLVFNSDVPEGLCLAGYPTGARIDYPAQYAENWQGTLGADSVSCAMQAPGLTSVTTRIAANVAKNAPVAKSVTLLGSEETIDRALDLNISPRVINEGAGSFNLEYKDPQLRIVDFKPTEGLIFIRVAPEEGCEIVGRIPLERVRLIGYDDLLDMTHSKVIPIQIDDSEYLTQKAQGLLTLRFDATYANFFTASIVDACVQGE